VALPTKKIYRRIDPTAVHETIVRLEGRIGARFPEAGLRKVAQELIDVSRDAASRVRTIRRRSVAVRLVSWLLALAILGILLTIPFQLRLRSVEAMTLTDGVGVLESALSASFFIGATILFIVTFESRLRRGRAMAAIHELRALAHVVDMHQLTKDPAMLLGVSGAETPHSPVRTYTPFELQRYLDYCSEMLALISKIAVLYVQDSADSDTVAIVDDIEDLTNGLSRKIWQKIMLIERNPSAAVAKPTASAAALDSD
jgi:hypothetical protein